MMAVVPTLNAVASPAGAPRPTGVVPEVPVVLMVATVTSLEIQSTWLVRSWTAGVVENVPIAINCPV